MKKPYETDWKEISEGVFWSNHHQLYWSKLLHPEGMVYCELSASHNGLIGLGAKLKTIIKENL